MTESICKKSLIIFVFLFSFILITGVPVYAENVDYDTGWIVFTAEDQSPVMSGAPSCKNYIIDSSHLRLDDCASASFGAIVTDPILGTDWGAKVTAKINGSFGFFIQSSDFSGGKMDVTYPVNLRLQYPAPNTFAPGQTISLSIPDYDVRNDASLTITEPVKSTMKLGVDVSNLSVAYSAEACLGGCFGIKGTENFSTVEFIPVEVVPKDNGKADFTIRYGGASATVEHELPYEIPYDTTNMTGVDGTIGYPRVTVGSSSLDNKSIVAKGEHTFITGDPDGDPDKLEYDLSGTLLPYPTGFCIDEGGFSLDINLGSINFETDITQEQTLTFSPDVEASFDGILTGVTIKSGNSYEFSLATADHQQITPTVSFIDETNFSNVIVNIYTKEVTLEVGKVFFDIDGDWGPWGGSIIEKSLAKLGSPEDTVADWHWQLGGFSPIDAAPFVLNPEDPRIDAVKEVSNVVNNGGGSRTVTFTIQLANDGDVPLTGVQAVDILSETFPGEWAAYTVDMLQSCELSTNESYDGTDLNGELLQGNVLLEDDGREVDNITVTDNPVSGIVVLQATVEPEPFPPLFTNSVAVSGTSFPVGTAVSDESQVDIDLGPSIIEGLDDFVLYAKHKVMFKDAGFVRGHVGSNRDIEIQKGYSGIVAGDLRAIEDIYVHGEITVDYAFANKSVKEPGKGQLNVTGAISEKVDQPFYVIPSFDFSAGGVDEIISTRRGDDPTELTPGSYGIVRILQGSKVILTSGDYFIRELYVEPRAKVFFDIADTNFDGKVDPVNINVVDKLNLQKGVVFEIASWSEGTTRDIFINVLQFGNILIQPYAKVKGIITAPNAKITFRRYSQLEGAAYARFITLEKGVEIYYHDDWYGELFRYIDVDCDGNSDIRRHPAE